MKKPTSQTKPSNLTVSDLEEDWIFCSIDYYFVSVSYV